ncbi:MAG: hypothetical protein AAF658_18360, partial [Myxococcota bacterium]
EDSALYEIFSDAENIETSVLVMVSGRGVFGGEPEVEVEFPGFRGPAANECSGQVCNTDTLELGNIGPGSSGTAKLTVRNLAICRGRGGTNGCTLCALNVFVGVDPVTDPERRFQLVGPTETELRQRSDECRQSGEITYDVTFSAPSFEGDYSALLVVQTNDPDEPVIQIPVRASSRTAPVAVADFLRRDPQSPSQPYTDPAEGIVPLSRVYLDGRGSFDPANPSDPSLITQYRWSVESAPLGADPDLFNEEGSSSSRFNFLMPLTGTYRVLLRVRNNEGVESGITERSVIEFTARPNAGLYAQLTWDQRTDLDLHLINTTDLAQVCGAQDCYFETCKPRSEVKPIWSVVSGPGEGGNPNLDRDETIAFGPETITVQAPEPGTYRLYVHAFSDRDSPDTSLASVRVVLGGQPVAEYVRELQENDLWAVADLEWGPAGGSAVQLQSDATEQNEVGQITRLTRDECRGSIFR